MSIFFICLFLCICLTSSLAEEKAREAESKARALELKLGDDLSKEARVRPHSQPNTHTSDPEIILIIDQGSQLFC